MKKSVISISCLEKRGKEDKMENITRRDFLKILGVSAMGLACGNVLTGCAKNKLYLYLTDYDEDTLVGRVDNTSSGYTSRTLSLEINGVKYNSSRVLKLSKDNYIEELKQLEKIFTEENENTLDDTSYVRVIYRTTDGFASTFANDILQGDDNYHYILYCDGLRVTDQMNLDDFLLIDGNKQVYLEPLLADEIGTENYESEITGKTLTKSL